MNLEGKDAQEADSVQPIGFGAPRASGDQDAGRLDNVVTHAARRQKSMQPKCSAARPQIAAERPRPEVDRGLQIHLDGLRIVRCRGHHDLFSRLTTQLIAASG